MLFFLSRRNSMYSQVWVLGKNFSNFPTCPRIAALFKCYIQRLLSVLEGKKEEKGS